MKLSVFTTVTDAERRGDNCKDALACYKELADEIVIVDGGVGQIWRRDNDEYMCFPWKKWPQEFSWEFIGQNFQAGYKYCTGDVVLHADLDFIFHENDFRRLRAAAQEMLDNHQPAMTCYKWQFIQPQRYNLKSRLVLMVNKRDFGDRIRFDSGGDLCQPSLDGVYIAPDDVPESKIPFYNYEKLTKTKEQVADDVGRMDRAWHQLHGRYLYGTDGSDGSAFEGWMKMVSGRYTKPQQELLLSDHPKYVQDTIRNLTPEQFGHSGWGIL